MIEGGVCENSQTPHYIENSWEAEIGPINWGVCYLQTFIKGGGGGGYTWF